MQIGRISGNNTSAILEVAVTLAQITGGMNPLSSINTPSWSHEHLLSQKINKEQRACKNSNNLEEEEYIYSQLDHVLNIHRILENQQEGLQITDLDHVRQLTRSLA